MPTARGVEVAVFDLADLASVRAWAQRAQDFGLPLDVLVNNAGEAPLVVEMARLAWWLAHCLCGCDGVPAPGCRRWVDLHLALLIRENVRCVLPS